MTNISFSHCSTNWATSPYLPPITVNHSKIGLNFTLQQKEAKWGLAFNVVIGKGKQELLVLIRWTIDGLIAGGGFEPPSLAKETRKKTTSLSCDVHIWKNHFSTFTYWLLEEIHFADRQYILGTRSHILPCTALCFSYHQTFSLQTSGKDGLEPPSPSYNWHVRNYLHFPINPDSRVSNMFIVLCFPLGCFMPCQPHGVISDISSPFTWIHVPFENSFNQRALRWCF